MTRSPSTLSPLVSLLRCTACGGELEDLRCTGCGAQYADSAGTVRMVPATLERAKSDTADSFAYEWEAFGDLRDEWRKNFLDYMRPHGPEFFDGKLVLDVGTGSGRHSRQAAELGARVVAADLGDSIDVARSNLPDDALTVQADAEKLPFAPETFDLVMSIGVLHHLPDPKRAFRAIVPLAKPGGWVHIYLYWQPPVRWHRTVLRAVNAVRRVTTRMPHRVLHALCYPLAAVLWAGVVLPYRALRARGSRLADAFPLKTYADYPFGVLVNDQFDRFSAPIENRYEKEDVERWLRDAGLEDITVLPNHGWLGSGRRPGAS
ncbi:MAG: class I SAM-dependent methyltransferase [Thermoleophilaceae bacterium]|nr:class I SAM-dependent methyltransferase [Thermoleophilaceae bacterium]